MLGGSAWFRSTSSGQRSLRPRNAAENLATASKSRRPRSQASQQTEFGRIYPVDTGFSAELLANCRTKDDAAGGVQLYADVRLPFPASFVEDTR